MSNNNFDWAGFWSSHKDYFNNLDAKYKAQEKAEEEKYKGMTTREVMEARHKELMEQEKNKYHTALNDTLNTSLGGYGTETTQPLYQDSFTQSNSVFQPTNTDVNNTFGVQNNMNNTGYVNSFPKYVEAVSLDEFPYKNNYLQGFEEWKCKDKNKSYLSAIKNSYDLLTNKQREMKQRNLINGDNIFHREGMCEVAQQGPKHVFAGLISGLANEFADFAEKNSQNGYFKFDKKQINQTFNDSVKDMWNNVDGTMMGIYYPNIPCSELFQNFDRNKNAWRVK